MLCIVCRLIGCQSILLSVCQIFTMLTQWLSGARSGKYARAEESIPRGLGEAGRHTRTRISSVERGRANVSFLTMKKIADGLGVPMSEIARIAELYEKERVRPEGKRPKDKAGRN